ncbi:MAG: glycosyltransferase, partial [Acidobacteriales bacterium]|nr:glycosyltransferase [Terriglobales bacterium]
QAGHDVTVACWTNISNNSATELQLSEAGVRLEYLRRGAGGKKIAGKKYLFLKLRRFLRDENIEIVHAHNPFYHYLYAALATASLRRPKLVETLHATVMFDVKQKWKPVFLLSSMLSDCVVFVCQESQEQIVRRFRLPRAKVTAIENGIDLAPYLAVRPRHPREEVVIGAVGRLAPEKNHLLLLQAVSKLLPRYANVRLRLLGSGELEHDLRSAAEALGIAKAVEFCGFSNDVPSFLSSLDLFALPSNSEAMPLTLIEAVASGLPVVATQVGSVPRFVDMTQSGWTAPPGDLQAFTKALESAILTSDLAQIGEQARARVSQHYSTARMAADYQALYSRLLGTPAPAAHAVATHGS